MGDGINQLSQDGHRMSQAMYGVFREPLSLLICYASQRHKEVPENSSLHSQSVTVGRASGHDHKIIAEGPAICPLMHVGKNFRPFCRQSQTRASLLMVSACLVSHSVSPSWSSGCPSISMSSSIVANRNRWMAMIALP
jgi:hypothetical protein